jgi:hypothetical protein
MQAALANVAWRPHLRLQLQRAGLTLHSVLDSSSQWRLFARFVVIRPRLRIGRLKRQKGKLTWNCIRVRVRDIPRKMFR